MPRPAAAIRKEISRLKLDIPEEELQAMLLDARRRKAREEQGSWELHDEEEENVRRRQAELASGQKESDDVNKMRGLRIRKARLRSVNRTRLRVRWLARAACMRRQRQRGTSISAS
jgi:hypothetical protein